MRIRLLPAAVAVTLLFGGCTGASADTTTTTAPAGQGPTSTGVAGTTRPLTSGAGQSAPGTSPAVDPRLATARTLNGRLTASLYGLVQSLKKVQADNTLAQVRRTLVTATTAARTAIKRQRAAAYPSSTRNCGTVRSAATQVGTAASQGATARGAISRQVGVLKADLTSLATVTTTVTRDRDALVAALTGLPEPPATVPTAEIAAALKEASDRRTEIEAAIKSVASASTEAGQTFDKTVGQSRTILSDACV